MLKCRFPISIFVNNNLNCIQGAEGPLNTVLVHLPEELLEEGEEEDEECLHQG